MLLRTHGIYLTMIGKALEYLFAPKEYNADMAMLRADNISETIADFAIKMRLI